MTTYNEIVKEAEVFGVDVQRQDKDRIRFLGPKAVAVMYTSGEKFGPWNAIIEGRREWLAFSKLRVSKAKAASFCLDIAVNGVP